MRVLLGARSERLMPGALDGLSAEVLGRHALARLQRLDVGGELPDLVGADQASPCRHAFGAALRDRLVDRARRATEVPAAVGEARPHRAAAVDAMAVDAVVADE